MLKKIVTSEYANLVIGVILLLTAGYEIYETFEESYFGTHHGIFAFSILQIMRAVTEIFHGLDEIEKSEEIKMKDHTS